MDDSPSTATTPTDGTHIGVRVRDLNEAMTRLAATFGYTWAEVLEWDAEYYLADGTHHVDPVRFTMSVGHPHWELMEAPHGIFAAEDGDEDFHHFARWVDDLPTEESRLLEAGYVREAWGEGLNGDIRYAYYTRPGSSMRLELCDNRELPNLRRWIGGGPFSD